MRHFLSFLALGALTAAASAAHAASITYTESATGSGTFDGQSFTGALVTFSGTGNTANITNPTSGIFEDIVKTSVTVAGLHTDIFTDIVAFIDNQNLNSAGLGDSTLNRSILFTANSLFGAYGLATAIGPDSGANGYNSGQAFATSGGSFTLSSINGNSTFQATIPVSTSITPEPSSLLLLATGSLGLAGAVRRHLSR